MKKNQFSRSKDLLKLIHFKFFQNFGLILWHHGEPLRVYRNTLTKIIEPGRKRQKIKSVIDRLQIEQFTRLTVESSSIRFTPIKTTCSKLTCTIQK